MENVRLAVSHVGDTAIARFNDSKIREESVIREIGTELDQLADQTEQRNVILNFADVEFMSSAALSHLLSLRKRLGQSDRKLKLCNVCDELRDIFLITQLTKIFDIEEDEVGALAAL